jgi:MFS family permease
MFAPLQATVISDRWGTRQFATLNGISSTPSTIAMAAAPFLGAAIAARLGDYPHAFYLLAVLILLASVTAAGTRTRTTPR